MVFFGNDSHLRIWSSSLIYEIIKKTIPASTLNKKGNKSQRIAQPLSEQELTGLRDFKRGLALKFCIVTEHCSFLAKS